MWRDRGVVWSTWVCVTREIIVGEDGEGGRTGECHVMGRYLSYAGPRWEVTDMVAKRKDSCPCLRRTMDDSCKGFDGVATQVQWVTVSMEFTTTTITD
jgi:hypothetical protein